MKEIIQSQSYMTMAMGHRAEPYPVTLNHSYDMPSNSPYSQCASEGKKLSFLSANPRAGGQVLEDRGYVEGGCDYRCVEFEGRASRVADAVEKRKALELRIDKLETCPDEAERKHLTRSSTEEVAIFRVDIVSMIGKKRVK